jgi:hypothetical protein
MTNILEEEDDCNLFGFYSYLVQIILAILAIAVLIGKISLI